MKKITANILCTTGATLILLAAVGIIFDARFLCIESVFQSLALNVTAHIGLLFTRKIESSYAILEYALDIGYVTAAAVFFGAIFDWYASIPLPVLVIMAAGIYLVSLLLSLVRTRREVEEINRLLKKRSSVIADITKEEK